MAIDLSDVPTEALSEPYKYLATGDEGLLSKVEKNELIFILNQLAGIDRVPQVDEDARGDYLVVPSEEAGGDAFDPHQYTGSVSRRELHAWTDTFWTE